LCSFLRSPVTSSLIGLNILLCTLFSNTFILCSSHNVNDHVSYPCRTTGKTIVSYILISKCSDSRETECSGPNGSKHYQNSISS
jgi:hypothetical protein